MKSFEEFVREGKAFKRRPNRALARDLIDSGLDRMRVAKNKFKLTSAEARYILENSYEALKELAEAELALHGYKSYSHEAAILFLRRFKEFSSSEIHNFNVLRQQRNGIKYYGKQASVEDAKFSLEFAEKLIAKLKLLLEKQMRD